MTWTRRGFLVALLILSSTVARAMPSGSLSLAYDPANNIGDVVWNSSGFFGGNALFLNTDNSGVYGTTNTGAHQWLGSVTSTIVSQVSGPSLRVFDFNSLTANGSMTLEGSMAAAIVVNGNLTVSGVISVKTARGLSGAGSAAAPGAMGGQGGDWPGFHIDPPCCGYSSGSGGGGGGNATQGARGLPGYTSPLGGQNGIGGVGGGANPDATVLRGGGGGGGGAAYASDCCNRFPGGVGGLGGGAALFVAGGNMLIGGPSNGAAGIHADGATGGWVDTSQGAGGGGAGGMLMFNVAGNWINYGVVSAKGALGGWLAPGTPSDPSAGGAGAGGYVIVDPLSIQNFGAIDVGGGNGNPMNGGILIASGIVNKGEILGLAQPVPEPATLTMMLIGICCLVAHRRR